MRQRAKCRQNRSNGCSYITAIFRFSRWRMAAILDFCDGTAGVADLAAGQAADDPARRVLLRRVRV